MKKKIELLYTKVKSGVIEYYSKLPFGEKNEPVYEGFGLGGSVWYL